MLEKSYILYAIVLYVWIAHQSGVSSDASIELKPDSDSKKKDSKKNVEPGMENFNFNEVDVWSKQFPKCAGKKQSPIDIKPESTENNKDETIYFNNFDQIPTKITLENTGNFLLVKMKFKKQPTLTIDPDKTVWNFHCLIFRWGSDPKYGSDHSINGKKFAAEMQVLHYDPKYGTLKEAKKHKFGLLIVAHMFKIMDNPTGFSNIAKYLKKLKGIGKKVNIVKGNELFSPEALDTVLTKEYYSYNGSLSIPPCTEDVKYIVNAEFNSITISQLKSLRKLKQKDGAKMNVRPAQPLNGRIIKKGSMSSA